MAECCDITKKIQEDLDKETAVYDNLLEIAGKFKRNTLVYALKIEKDSYQIKTGTINSVTYNKMEITLSVRKCETDKDSDFTISSKSWELYQTPSDLFERLGNLMPTNTTE